MLGAVLYIGLGVTLGTWAFWDTYGDYEPVPTNKKTTQPKVPNPKSTYTQTVTKKIKFSDVSPVSREQMRASLEMCIEKQGLLDPTFAKPSQLIFTGKAENKSLTHISGKGPIATCMLSAGITKITLQSATLSETEGNEQWLLLLP